MIEATHQTLPDEQTAPVAAKRQNTVFVVEDDLDTREAITELFSPEGMKVRTFGSAEEFLSGYTANGPSCLLLDERLPGMGGSELLRRLRDRGIHVPSIVVTAYATTPTTVAAMQNGATTVLDKPCSDSRLREAVVEALEAENRRLEQQAGVDRAKAQLAELSENERLVLEMVLNGTPNKQNRQTSWRLRANRRSTTQQNLRCDRCEHRSRARTSVCGSWICRRLVNRQSPFGGG